MIDKNNYDLTRHNTFGISASCDRYIEVATDDEAKALPSLLADGGPVMLLGGGSNLLLTGDYHGTVVHSAIRGVEPAGGSGDTLLVRVGSGEVWDDFVALCVDRGWHGAENLSLIPGEVGASAVQNIGAYGAEVKDIIDSVEAVELATGRLVNFTAAECRYGYRQSRFKQDWKGRYLVTHVVYRLSARFQPRLDYGNIRAELIKEGIATPTASQQRRAIIRIREAKLPDPKVEGNAGSFFMNPVVERTVYERLAARYPGMPHYEVDGDHVKIPAGWMIDQCGWKGRSLGRAGVHDRQALVLVNRGGATGQDIITLCRQVMSDVKDRFGIDIHPEVNII